MAKDYQLAGTVKEVFDVQTFNSGFTKREFVVSDTDGKFPQDIKFECIKDKCSLLDGVGAGEPVTVHFNIRGNEHNGRYYVNLQAWRIEKGEGGESAGGGREAGPAELDEPPPGHGAEAGEDGIPF
jgi:hypothetical protein